MISKEDLLKIAKKEFATTIKVLKAYPSERFDFRPHERSSNVLQLASNFVFEMYLLASFVFGEKIDRSKYKSYKPETTTIVVEDFEKEAGNILSRLQEMSENDLKETVEFAGHKFTAEEFIIMMIHDQIHHRGQLTVYIRLAGGKVPSIYGPSADDNSTNF